MSAIKELKNMLKEIDNELAELKSKRPRTPIEEKNMMFQRGDLIRQRVQILKVLAENEAAYRQPATTVIHNVAATPEHAADPAEEKFTVRIFVEGSSRAEKLMDQTRDEVVEALDCLGDRYRMVVCKEQPRRSAKQAIADMVLGCK